ncbi:MAG: FtsX-like permease family protein [Desulfatirhabdiaceae bacterium]
MTWMNIALRNLLKNRRRSLFTMLAITLGFSAVNLFGGFTTYMYAANREGSIYTSFLGHLVVARKGFLDRDSDNPKKYVLSPKEMDFISKSCKDIPEVLLTTPQLRINGLITDGLVSTIFLAQGIVPSVQDVFTRQSRLNLMEPYEGKALSDSDMHGIGVSKGLARFLKLGLGSESVIMGTTVDGQMNALDVVVFNLFDSPAAAANDRFLRIPFELAQTLYDTDGAHFISILLKDTQQTESIRNRLKEIFLANQLDLDIKTWNELSEWYTKVKEMFDIIFLFLFIIVFIIVIMSVINTMSMAVLERTREIGTLRSLGLKRRGIIQLFTIESGLLGIGGIIGGTMLTLAGWSFIYFFKPKWTPPGVSVRIPLQLEFSLYYVFISVIFLLLLCMIASIIPARKAAYRNVVDALGHV